MRRIDIAFLLILIGVAALAVHAFNPRRWLVENDDSKLIGMALSHFRKAQLGSAKAKDIIQVIPGYKSKRLSTTAAIRRAIRGFSRHSKFPEVESLRDLLLVHPEGQSPDERNLVPLEKLDLPPLVSVIPNEVGLAKALGAGRLGRTVGVACVMNISAPGYSRDGEIAVVILDASSTPQTSWTYIFELEEDEWKLVMATPE
jgi:hypothetical protein